MITLIPKISANAPFQLRYRSVAKAFIGAIYTAFLFASKNTLLVKIYCTKKEFFKIKTSQRFFCKQKKKNKVVDIFLNCCMDHVYMG